MRRLRNMFVIIILNIFLMLMVSVLMEYNNLAQRLSLLEDNVSLALDRSIDASTASEELFTATYQEDIADSRMASHGTTGVTDKFGTSPKKSLGANMTIWGGTNWYDASSYVLAGFYETNKRLPNSQSEYKGYENSTGMSGEFATRGIYDWLFGRAGHNYNHYDWCNNSTEVMTALEDANIAWVDRAPNPDFYKFYNEIGKSILVNGVVKRKKSADSFDTIYKVYPVLDNMGLDFNDEFTGDSDSHGGIDAIYMTDNFCMSEHAGKLVKGVYTKYYITPYSLGVTYVPIKVLKPVFIGNLDTMARLQKVASGAINSDANLDFKSASECIKPTVYTGTTFTQQTHYNKDNHHIVTDGNIEYDLDSVKMRVDYYTADFYNEAYKNITAKIEGSVTGKSLATQDDALRKTVQSLKATDTYLLAKNANVKDNAVGNRIVAKVTVRLKVYVLYQSSILQWVSFKDWKANGSKGEWHAAIKEINPKTGQIIGRDAGLMAYLFGENSTNYGSDGTWFETSTYFAVTR